MKTTKREISHLFVREGESDIACQAVAFNGSSYTAVLGAGRYECEGYIEYERRRFLGLRGADGGLKIVEERALAKRGRGRVRRVYRKGVHGTAGGGRTGVERLITEADRTVVRRLMRASIPDWLPEYHLGRYEECGSVDSWTVAYSIERCDGEWFIRCEGPDGERESGGFSKVEELVEDAWDRGYRPEYLVEDLRRTRRPHLLTLAGEVEEVAIAKGLIEIEEPAPPPAPAPEPQPASQPAPPAPKPDPNTWVDDAGVRYYRHPPAPVRAFEAVLNVPGRASNLTIGTQDGSHEIDVEVRAHREGAMQAVLRVHGKPAADGGLELIVTDVLTGAARVVGV